MPKFDSSDDVSRRSFLQKASVTGVATAFTIVKPELVRGWGKDKLKAGVVGCGGRGTQAVLDLFHGSENVDLVAMGDLFEDKLEASLTKIRGAEQFKDRIKVSPEHHFVGFEAYKKVLASDIDIVMLCAPPGYRPMHFEAAIEARKHVFCEKPFGTDPVNVRRFMDAAKKSEELKLTVMSGAQRRNQREYLETIDQIRNGAIGDVVAAYAWWEGSPVFPVKAREPQWADMTWEHREWYSFVWICGDQIVEQHLHNIDAVNWALGMHPIKVKATGGAVWRPREELYGNIYDHISAEFEYPNGIRMSSYCRQFPKGLPTKIGEELVGTKGRSNLTNLAAPGPKSVPYVAEHTALIASIRGEGPYVNHGIAVAESTMTCIMARESAYSGETLTWEQMMNSQLDLMPKEFGYDLKMDVPPLPVPGVYKFI